MQLGSLAEGAATTLGSLDAARDGLGATLDRAPAAMRDATADLHAMSPVLADAARLAVGLRPGADLLPRATRGLADTAQTGAPVLRRATRLGPDLEDLLNALGALSKDPSTSGAVTRLTKVVASLGPTLRFINPFQTQCNYLGLWTRNASLDDLRRRRERHVVPLHPGLPDRRVPAALHARAADARDAVRQRRRRTSARPATSPTCPASTSATRPGCSPNHTELTAPPPGTPEGPR